MMRAGMLGRTEADRRLHATAAKLNHGPMCAACQFAKQRRKPTPGTTTKVNQFERNALKTDNLFPGSCVSVDHFVCNPRGRLLNTFGKERLEDKHVGGCIHVDHATGCIHVESQSQLNTHETMRGTTAFERHCADYGVIPQKHITDEGSVFASAEFAKHLEQFRIHHNLAAPGAHHANGIAERNIGTSYPQTSSRGHA